MNSNKKTPFTSNLTIGILIGILLSIYWIEIFRYIELPGLYMDAINPDYLAAHILNSDLNNPVWTLPTKWFPILGNLYHGVQNLYIGIPVYWLLGTNIVSARIAQALFGAAIIVLVFFIILRITKSRLFALLAALCLATDISFIASFRTQNYIILGGMVWLLSAILPLIENNEYSFSKKRLLASGVFFGLAIYGYFVFAFFFPVFIYQVVRVARKGFRFTSALIWCVGGTIGMVPYVLGYLSMGIALGGVAELLDYLRSATHSLAPLSSTLSFLDGYKYSFDTIKLAMSNGGNELMIFGKVVSSGLWTTTKFEFFVLAIGFLILFLLLSFKSGGREKAVSDFPLVLLPCSYIFFSGILGQRLWAHHFSVMTPFLYLLGVQFFHEAYLRLISVQRKEKYDGLNRIFLIIIFVVTMFGNFIQQNNFFKQLDNIGGIGKTSNSLTLLANEAISNPSPTIYLFPEWGFFMPFTFLTANKIPYRLDISKAVIDEARKKYLHISIVFWEIKDAEKYEMQLISFGVEKPVLKIYSRKDGFPAFYALTAAL